MAQDPVLAVIAEAYAFAAPNATLEQIRDGYDRSMARGGVPDRVSLSPGRLRDVEGMWFRPKSASRMVILYLHGGGFQFGSSRSHGPLAGRIAVESGADVFVADYRRAPEHPFPAALEDAVTALTDLIEGYGAGNVVIAGDSAGGGLVLATLLAVKQSGVRMPAGAVVLSAWTDLSMSGASMNERAGVDPLVSMEALTANVAAYLGAHDPRDPLASPLFGDLSGLPPLYMQVGTREVLYDDTQRFAERVRAAGGSVTVDVETDMPHVHQILLWRLPEAGDSLSRVGSFIRGLSNQQLRMTAHGT